MFFPLFTSLLIVQPLLLFALITTNNNDYYIGVYDDTNVYNWFEAKAYCMRNYGSTLASIHSNTHESQALNARVTISSNIWVGLTNLNEKREHHPTWQWSDGTSYDYALNWVNNVNNVNNIKNIQSCVEYQTDDQANNLSCYSTISQFICNLSQNWRPIFQINSNNNNYHGSQNSYQYWMNGISNFDNYNDDSNYILNRFNARDSNNENYRSIMIDDWSQLVNNGKFNKIKVSLYRNQSEVIYFMFYASIDTDSWFSKNFLIDSSYGDVIYQSYDSWTLNNQKKNSHHFWQIVNNESSCHLFNGLLLVSENSQECSEIWNPSEGEANPQIYYSTNINHNNVETNGLFSNSTQVTTADSLVVYVNANVDINVNANANANVKVNVNTARRELFAMNVSNISSLTPSNQPTMIPTYYGADYYNYTVILAILLVNDAGYTINEIKNSISLQKDIISALKLASIETRYDLTDALQIAANIESIGNYSSDNSIAIGIEIGFKTESVFSRWYFDISYVIIEFESNLKSIWNISNEAEFDLTLNYLTILNADIISTLSSSSMTTSDISTTNDAIRSDDSDDSSSIESLGDYFNYTLFVLGGLFLVVTSFAWYDSKHSRKSRHNELFKITTMGIAATYFMDVISDIFFVLQVWIGHDSTIEIIVAILALLFIIIPILTNFWQLHNEIQVWATDVDSKVLIQAWLQNHLRALYAISVICGSAFTAIELCNSNLFHLSVFNMGLNRRQKALFKNQRIFSTVLLENIPQLILQSIYSVITSSVSPITLFASMFSLLSIVSTIFEHISAKILLSAETVLVIKMHIHSQDIVQMRLSQFKVIQNHRMMISNEMSKVLEIDRRLIELLLPIQTKKGVDLKFHIRSDINQEKTLIQTIRKEVDTGFLADAFYRCWAPFGVTRVPKIGNIETKEIRPDSNLRGEASDVAAVISLNSQSSDRHLLTSDKPRFTGATSETLPGYGITQGGPNQTNSIMVKNGTPGGNGGKGGSGNGGTVLFSSQSSDVALASTSLRGKNSEIVHNSSMSNHSNNNNNNNNKNENGGPRFTNVASVSISPRGVENDGVNLSSKHQNQDSTNIIVNSKMSIVSNNKNNSSKAPRESTHIVIDKMDSKRSEQKSMDLARMASDSQNDDSDEDDDDDVAVDDIYAPKNSNLVSNYSGNSDNNNVDNVNNVNNYSQVINQINQMRNEYGSNFHLVQHNNNNNNNKNGNNKGKHNMANSNDEDDDWHDAHQAALYSHYNAFKK